MCSKCDYCPITTEPLVSSRIIQGKPEEVAQQMSAFHREHRGAQILSTIPASGKKSTVSNVITFVPSQERDWSIIGL